ncbi:MAG TPA: DUF5995 family protein [Candidatus Saccharimonadales bacterium]|nr:DUF5995 family protein [Candidatus Saccharimonadales bacterium]
MAHDRTLIIDTRRITSVKAVLRTLRMLDARLPATSLRHLATFNRAYVVVTTVISEASQAQRFKNPAFIEAFSVCFANYYFAAINTYIRNDSQLPAAWTLAIDGKDAASRPEFIGLLLGANAHINYDLPLALADTVQENKAANLLKDIATVDKLLIKSGKQILGTFKESNKFAAFVKRRGRFLYFRPIMWTILYWRVVAWQKYRALKKQKEALPSIARRSAKIAVRLTRIGALLSLQR